MVRSSWLLQESESTGVFVTQRSSMSPERIVLKFTITGSLLYKQTRHCYAVLVLKLYCFFMPTVLLQIPPSSLDFYGSMQVHWTCNVMKIFSSCISFVFVNLVISISPFKGIFFNFLCLGVHIDVGLLSS